MASTSVWITAAKASSSAAVGTPPNDVGSAVTPPGEEMLRKMGVVAPITPMGSPPASSTTDLVIVAAKGAQLNDVVYVDETSSQLAVQGFHIDTTYRASSPKVSNALVACTSVTFVSIDEHPSSLPLFEQGAFDILVCKNGCFVDLVRAKSPVDSDGAFDIEMWHGVSNACKRERCAISNARSSGASACSVPAWTCCRS